MFALCIFVASVASTLAQFGYPPYGSGGSRVPLVGYPYPGDTNTPIGGISGSYPSYLPNSPLNSQLGNWGTGMPSTGGYPGGSMGPMPSMGSNPWGNFGSNPFGGLASYPIGNLPSSGPGPYGPVGGEGASENSNTNVNINGAGFRRTLHSPSSENSNANANTNSNPNGAAAFMQR